MLFEAHRGYSLKYPENTLPAFMAAKKAGFDMVELDTAFTSDGKCVVLHDKTLNRVCRNKDGSEISENIEISSVPYSEVLRYDAGIRMGEEFAGTAVPLLSEVLDFCKSAGIPVKIDNRIAKYSEEKLRCLVDICLASGAVTEYTCPSLVFAEKMRTLVPDCVIHYDGEIREDLLCSLANLLGAGSFTTWLPVKNRTNDWVKLPFADAPLCEKVKKFSKLGLWKLISKEELDTAAVFGADIIETEGYVLPSKT